MKKLTEQEKKEISVKFKDFLDYFYCREVSMGERYLGKQLPTDPDIDLASKMMAQILYLSQALPVVLPLLESLGISDLEFIRYIEEHQQDAQKRDAWYYKQEFEPFDPPEY